MEKNLATLNENHVPLPGSECSPQKGAKLIGPADEAELIKITIVLRRRTDGEPIPDFSHFTTPLANRPRLEMGEFARKHGAHPEDTSKVVEFIQQAGLKIVETHAARRTVVASGTVGQLNKAFSVQLAKYEHTVERRKKGVLVSSTETYRMRDSAIYLSKELSEIVIGVFGIDNKPISKANGYPGDPINTKLLTFEKIRELYNFPTNAATGQTIAIYAQDGYVSEDITESLGYAPSLTNIIIDEPFEDFGDFESTQNICVAAGTAPGAAIAVYMTQGYQDGWVNVLNRVIHPDTGDPHCSVFSSSYSIYDADDETFPNKVDIGFINAVTMAFQDAAVQGVTVCVATGDAGTQSNITDGKAHVQYPASDPWVLAVGGTTVGNINGNTCEEYVWNDTYSFEAFGTNTGTGATGGGVSTLFPMPNYQNNVDVPFSLTTGKLGRGIPDVAANASPNSGYQMYLSGNSFTGFGTSLAAPLWAGLIAVINAALGKRLGFINPFIYQFGSIVFRDIVSNPGATDNGYKGTPGYPALKGWDACTGWGSPYGAGLLNAFKDLGKPKAYVLGGYQSTDIIITDLTTSLPVPIGGLPGTMWDTLLKPNTNYGLSVQVHNASAYPANSVEVRFWSIPGGLGIDGPMLGSPVMVSIPAYGSVIAQCATTFLSAAFDKHMCAVVSIYNPASGCTVEAATALQIPDPGQTGSESCSAWRNTDSMLAPSNTPFNLKLGLGKVPFHLIGPVNLLFHSTHLPGEQRAAETDHLSPEFRQTLRPIDLKTKLQARLGARIEEKGANEWHVIPNGIVEEVSFDISGVIPPNAKNGDKVLMNISAYYPARERPGRTIEFLEVIHVTNSLRA